ncbi:G-type lectin S-receptor-like serine/threonine-protein kinase At4g27290 isoform X4 [Apium graveolens]|uniref:G-type lectin S-receptor-like serine/threonine-protein kinase At4g27290 isoform X4 n=1 Tax=Apium graveolens TaxID=4045 RepID=UPI003D7B04A0
MVHNHPSGVDFDDDVCCLPVDNQEEKEVHKEIAGITRLYAKNVGENLNVDEDLELPLFDFKTLAKATNGFSTIFKLGEGGFGSVYKEGERMLVYEYMPNKSLDSFIFDKNQSKGLDWHLCYDIIYGITRGVLYLHQDSRLQIILRDLKASNVLLDHDMNPKISDFGTARICGDIETGANTTRVVGTYEIRCL